MHTRTPPEITKHITRLVRKVAHEERPIYIDVNPALGALVNECFANVAAMVGTSGGEVAYGWQLWEWPHVLVEAEFHAVWRAPDGKLHEITPKQDGEKQILFVPDRRRTYAGTPVDNVRLAVRDDPLVHNLISVAEEIVKVRIRSGKEVRPGCFAVPDDEIQPLLVLRELIGQMLSLGLRANDLCGCGRGRKYKNCHGKLFD